MAMVFLGVRPVGFTRSFSPLGRETFITDADWVDGWIRPRVPTVPPVDAAPAVHFDFSDPQAILDLG